MAKRRPRWVVVLFWILCVFGSIAATWAILLGIVSVLAAGAGEPVNVDMALLPTSLPGWTRTGGDRIPSGETLEGWGVTSDACLDRTYMSSEGNEIQLLLIYKGNELDKWHSPEGCFEGYGYHIRRGSVKIPYAGHQVTATKLTAQDADGNKIVSVFMFTSAKEAEATLFRAQVRMAKSRFRSPDLGWAMVRVNASVTTTEANAERDIRSFLKAVSKPLSAVLGGKAPAASKP